MNDVIDILETWRQRDEQIAVATVVETWGSAPRPVGSKLITTLSGHIAGSVSGGCVEGAVIEEGHGVVKSGKPRLLAYGVTDDDAWDVGLACGGTIRVFVEPLTALGSIYPLLKQKLDAREPMAVINVLDGPPEWINRKLLVDRDGDVEGDLELSNQITPVVETAQELLEQGTGGMLLLRDGTTLFIEVYPPVPRLIVIGAVHIAEVLVPMAKLAGFDTIVVDPRGAFATRERFPHATELIVDWPQNVLPRMELSGSTYITVLTHDPKLDDPSLLIALKSKARYVGALGSPHTNAKRLERLRQSGLANEELARLHAPIGLPLSGQSPGEIAVSIMAEIVQAKNNTLIDTTALE